MDQLCSYLPGSATPADGSQQYYRGGSWRRGGRVFGQYDRLRSGAVTLSGQGTCLSDRARHDDAARRCHHGTCLFDLETTRPCEYTWPFVARKLVWLILLYLYAAPVFLRHSAGCDRCGTCGWRQLLGDLLVDHVT